MVNQNSLTWIRPSHMVMPISQTLFCKNVLLREKDIQKSFFNYVG